MQCSESEQLSADIKSKPKPAGSFPGVQVIPASSVVRANPDGEVGSLEGLDPIRVHSELVGHFKDATAYPVGRGCDDQCFQPSVVSTKAWSGL